MAKRKGIFWNVKGDLMASVVVFLIALPLCLAIAQASGAPLFSGIVAGIIGGAVVGLFSKSQLSVSGPAAGLVAIVLLAIEHSDGFNIFLCSVVVAGAIQLLFGALKAGTVATYFPTNVIEGMLAGIGLTIIFKQIHYATGYVNKTELAGVEDADDGFLLSSISDSLKHVEPGAILITLIGLAILIMWTTKPFKKLQLIPAGLIVVLVGTILNQVFKTGGSFLYLDEAHLVKLPIPSSTSDLLHQFTLPDFSGFKNISVWKNGLIIAAVASIETLLCIEATDKLDPLKRSTPGNGELVAQGIGNMVSGFIGGLPITSVIVRSSANINAGARTKLSTMAHGILLLVCVATIPIVLNLIPKAALAAILIFTGYRLARPAIWQHMWHAGLKQFIPFVATAVAVLCTDLLKGVALGLIISIFYILRQNLRTPYFFNRSEYHGSNDIIRLALAQEVSFLNKASIKTTFQHLPENSCLVLDASNTAYIDFDVIEEIKDFRDFGAPEKNIDVKFLGFKKDTGIENTHKEDQDDYTSYDDFLANYLKVSK